MPLLGLYNCHHIRFFIKTPLIWTYFLSCCAIDYFPPLLWVVLCIRIYLLIKETLHNRYAYFFHCRSDRFIHQIDPLPMIKICYHPFLITTCKKIFRVHFIRHIHNLTCYFLPVPIPYSFSPPFFYHFGYLCL